MIIGSKKFTESVILGEMISQKLNHSGYSSMHKRELGGTRVLWNGLLQGEIDIYIEYTGTIIQEIFAGESIDENNLSEKLKSFGVLMSKPLGFNNTYAIGMLRKEAEELNINSISDLRDHLELKFGLTNEFMDRRDGWSALRNKYNLINHNAIGIDHDIAYRGLAEGSINVIDLYSTDAEIKYYDIKKLKDDKKHFTDYHAVILYRSELLEKFPGIEQVLLKFEGAINADEMITLNASVKINGSSEISAAGNFLNKKFTIEIENVEKTFIERLIKNTREHLFLVLISLFFAIIVSIPLGIYARKNEPLGKIILGLVGIIQTIPSLAILVFMIPFFGIGAEPAIVALFLYSLLPIVRNTYLGLEDIDTQIKESAIVLGLSKKYILRKIELPLAARSIIAGVKTSAVINIGTATLGALIGAGGYGQPILTGIRLDNIQLILEGAVPAAMLAILAQLAFDAIEKLIVPKGLRIKAQ
ncbi:MAG: ABC transporter permease subunit [Ignavibacteriae bacterium]|nr:ABC transporter permease subunit [Ignavibacteriota bacterium]NOG96742.1 ABC transporter permease subunit [Ignavibacteriota bacterium]